jgi:hypothetical protein
LGNNQASAPCNGCPVFTTKPKANAGLNQSIVYPTTSATLTGVASSDSNGTITSYVWSQVSGPSASVLSLASLVSPTVTGLVPGTYVYQLKVTDNGLKSDSSSVIVIVVKPNLPPVANAGEAQSITMPSDSVILDGSASYDPDGSIVSYNWTVVSGPCGATIASPHAARSLLTFQQQGSYALQLTVTDNSGASSSAQTTITVKTTPIVIKMLLFYSDGSSKTFIP